jgi:hypothetical protein
VAVHERIAFYEALEQHRGKPLIAYVTSTRPQADGLIAQDAIPELQRQLESLPKDANDLDLLVVS